MDSRRKRLVRVGALALILLLVSLLLTSQVVSAVWWKGAWLDSTLGVIKIIIDFGEFITNIKISTLIDWLSDIVKTAVNFFFDTMKFFLTWNPVVYPSTDPDVNPIVTNIVPVIMSVIHPLFVMLTVITGIYYIFAAMDPKRRSAAKNMLLKLLVGMVIVGLSMPIFQLLLTISDELTKAVFDEAFDQFAGSSSNSIAMFAVILSTAIVMVPQLFAVLFYVGLYLLLAVIIVMAVRYLAVLVFAILFPAALFMYFFDGTKKLGATIIYQTIAWIFIPVVQALMIVITFFALEGMITGNMPSTPQNLQLTMNGMSTSGVGSSPSTIAVMFFMVLAGLVGVILAPLIMMQLLKWVGGAISGASMLNIGSAETSREYWKYGGLTALGGTMTGGLARGLSFAASEAAYMGEGSPMFGDTKSWKDMLPTRGVAASPWKGAAEQAKNARIARGERRSGDKGLMKERKGLFGLRDFFGTYHDILTYDKRKSARLITEGERQTAMMGSGDKGESSDRGTPGSPHATLSQSGKDKISQYSEVGDDASGARSRYMPKVEGPPFMSIPLYFLGGLWGKSLGRASKHFDEGRVWKGIGVSVFETFKVFSPFRPVRHLGRILYTAIPEFVPPIFFPVPFMGWNLRSVAWKGAKMMNGIGFGQVASRVSWSSKLMKHEMEYNEAKDAHSITGMNAAAEKYMKVLETIRDGGELRGISDPDYYYRKLSSLWSNNKDLHFDVMKSMAEDMGSRGDIRKALASVKENWGKRGKLKTDEERLLHDYIEDKFGNVASFEARSDAGLDDFAGFKAAMALGVGCEWDCDFNKTDTGEGEPWSIKGFDLDAMEKYIKTHREAMGVGLVKVGEDGKYSRSSHRVLTGDAYSCASKNEMIAVPGHKREMQRTNLHIIDAQRGREAEIIDLESRKAESESIAEQEVLDAQIKKLRDTGRANIYSLVDTKGSMYVERMKGYLETGGGIRPFRGVGDDRTEQGLDYRGIGFMNGFSYRRTDGGNFMVFFRGKAITNLNPEEKAYVIDATKKSPEQIKRDDVKLSAVQAKRELGATDATALRHEAAYNRVSEAQNALQQRGLSQRKKESHFKALEDAQKELVKARDASYKKVREAGVQLEQRATYSYVLRKYGGQYLDSDMRTALLDDGYTTAEVDAFGSDATEYGAMLITLRNNGFNESRVREGVLNNYGTVIDKLDDNIYFNGDEVAQLRAAGYKDEHIDELRLLIYNNDRVQEIIGRGETLQVNITANVDDNEVATLGTDDAGRRTLNLNVLGEDTGMAGTQEGLAQLRDELFIHLENGAIIGHEMTHDRIREQYGAASYEDISRDFVSDDTKMRNVFDEASLTRVKEGIAGALGMSPTLIGDEVALDSALLMNHLTREDLGEIVCEALADAGEVQGLSTAENRRWYDHTMDTFVGRVTDNVGQVAREEGDAGITPGSLKSKITREDVFLVSRMKSLTTATNAMTAREYIAPAMGMEDKVDDVLSVITPEGAARNQAIVTSLYQAVHNNAKLI